MQFNDEKYSYISMTDDNYVFGVITLAKSLRKVSSIPFHCMCLPMKRKDLLQRYKINTIDIKPIQNPHVDFQKRFLYTYSKLNAFNMVQFDKIVFIDSDAIVTTNIDDLFKLEGFNAAPDHGITLNSNRFNSGVFVTRPSKDVFNDMISKISTTYSYNGSDQGFLNSYFQNRWNKLSPEYNYLKRLIIYFPDRFNYTSAKVIHYVGDKPWDFSSSEQKVYSKIYNYWFEIFPHGLLNEIILFQNNRAQQKYTRLKDRITHLETKNRDINIENNNYKKQIKRLLSSKSYKIGKVVTLPFSIMIKMIKSIK